jgi:diguanylate cyclase (GGDEF)-like protein
MPMEGFRYGGARLRLLVALIVLFAIAPIFALYVVRLHESRTRALAHAYVQASQIAHAGSEAHAQFGLQARHFLEVVSQIPAVRDGSLSDCDDLLQWLTHGRGWLTSIFVTDADGKGLCGSHPTARTVNIADRAYYQQMKKDGGFVVSDVVLGRVTNQQVVAAAHPIYGPNGKLMRVLGVGMPLNWIDQIAAQASAKHGGILIALDRNNRVLAYQPERPASWVIGQHKVSPLVDLITDQDKTSFEALDESGERRIFGVSRLADGSMTIAVGLKRSEVLEPIERTFMADLLFLLVTAGGSVVTALLLAEFGLLRGMRTLKNSALRLKAGRMGLRVNLPRFTATELHDLAHTYNAMTAEFERIAYLDRLTGLPNRRYLERNLNERNDNPARARKALLAIDLDGFKPVNDTYGHATGDKVLALIARRIASVVDERGLLARVGGDEFVAIVPMSAKQDRISITALGEEIRKAMQEPIEIDGMKIPVGCSIGIALVPDDAQTLSGAMVMADAALYEAKRNGRNLVVSSAPPLATEAMGDIEDATHWAALGTIQRW